MIRATERLLDSLHRAGVAISTADRQEVRRALKILPIENRDVVRAALRTCVVRDARGVSVFNALFEIYFPVSFNNNEVAQAAALSDVALRDALRAEFDRDEDDSSGDNLSALARLFLGEAVRRYSSISGSSTIGANYFLLRSERGLQFDDPIWQVGVSVDDTAESPASVKRRQLRRAKQLLAARRIVLEEIDRELLALHGDRFQLTVQHDLADVDLVHASKNELRDVRRAVRPIARHLATRLARAKRAGRVGRLDMRKSIRRAMSTGGVVFDPMFHRARPRKPDLVVIADVSGSVATFARFTLLLLHGLSSEFRLTKCYLFIDGVADVTTQMRRVRDPDALMRDVVAHADLVRADGHSNYGNVFYELTSQHLRNIRASSTVLLLGDARSNYHAPRGDMLGILTARAKRTYWLNPEPKAYWNSGDSVASLYAAYVDDMLECRTLRQLDAFVRTLA